MRRRKRLHLLLLPALLSGLLVHLATPASAVQTRTRVCNVAGTLDVNPGAGGLTVETTGNYDFDPIALICAGSTAGTGGTGPEMTGVGSMDSAGSFGVGACGGTDVRFMSSFCGTYAMGGFLIGPSCSGTLGGDEAANLNPVNVLANDWSVMSGATMVGGVTCDTMAVPNQLTSIGVIGLVVVPNPLSLCPGPLPSFCQLIVAGVIVMTSVGAP